MPEFLETSLDPPGRPGADDATPENAAIWSDGLAKSYRRRGGREVVRALEPLTLRVRRGEIFGFLGHNGAGKTTTIKLLTGLILPTEGRAFVAGAPARSVRARARIGFLPENPSPGEAWTAREFLVISSRLVGMRGPDASRQIDELTERLSLASFLDRRLKKLSKGQVQLVALAHAVLGRPQVLILDEPMSGLDPMVRKRVKELLLDLRAQARSIFFSSHILSDVEELCDRVALIKSGHLRGVYSLDEIHAAGRSSIRIAMKGVDLRVVAQLGLPIEEIREAGGRVTVRLVAPERLDETLGLLLRAGAHIQSVTPRGATLEEFVLTTIGSKPAGASEEPSSEPRRAVGGAS